MSRRPRTTDDTDRRPWSTPILWASCAVAALVLILGVDGTLAGWSQALVVNSTNTAATSQAVILKETSGATTCTSADGSQVTVNSFTCTTINKYGGTATPLVPGTNRTVDVTFTNAGSANATSFSLTPGTCTQTPTAGTGTPAAANLCTNGDLTVALGCTPGSTYLTGTWIDLAYLAGAPPTTPASHTALLGDLNAGSSWTCRFTVALAANAGVADQGITVSQPLTWTLTQ